MIAGWITRFGVSKSPRHTHASMQPIRLSHKEPRTRRAQSDGEWIDCSTSGELERSEPW